MVRITCCIALVCLTAAGQARVQFDLVDRAVIERRLKLDSSNNEQRLNALRKLFEEAGCSGDRLTTQAVKRADTPNLICTLRGESDSVIVIGGHFDALFAGKGIADNWSGAALLPSIFQSLKNKPRRHTLVFIGFAGEERGLLGALAYVKQFKKEDRERIRAMVNMDTLGLGPAAIWMSRADQQLVKYLVDVSLAFKIQLHAVNVEKVGSADSEVFRLRKIPAITFHSITQETWPILHSARDQLDVIRMDDYFESYRLLAAFAAYLDLRLDPEITSKGTGVEAGAYP